MSDALAKILEQYKDASVPGGCESCDAHQTVEQIADSAWKIVVHHDAGCAFLAEHEKKRGRR